MGFILLFFFPLSPFFFFLQRPHKIFQLAETNCHPHTIWQTEMQLDLSTCKAKKTVQMDQKWEQVLFFQVRLFVCFKVNLQGDFFLFRLLLFFFLHEAQSSPSGPTVTAVPLIEDDNITAGLPPSLFLTEIKPIACPYVLPSPSVLLQTAWLRSSLRMGQCPLIRAQPPSCPGQVSPHPGAVPSMPWLVPDWIPPSNPFQRLSLFFSWIRYAVWFSFPFVMCRVKGELGRL